MYHFIFSKMHRVCCVLVLIACLVFVQGQSNPWSVVDQALQKGIDTFGYPGCVAMVGDASVSD